MMEETGGEMLLASHLVTTSLPRRITWSRMSNKAASADLKCRSVITGPTVVVCKIDLYIAVKLKSSPMSMYNPHPKPDA